MTEKKTLKFELQIVDEATIGEYHLTMTSDDPYYFVEVKKDGKRFDVHLLKRESEFKALKKRYEKLIPIESWEGKADWLHRNGYHLVIQEYNGGMQYLEEDDPKWMAHTDGEWRTYGKTIPDVITQIYDSIHSYLMRKESFIVS